MTAYIVLAAVALLLALLMGGRSPTALLFTVWAAGFHLTGLVSERDWLLSYSNSALITLIVLLQVSLALERSPLLDRLTEVILKGRPSMAVLRFSTMTCVISAFINNTAVVGTLLGVISRQRHQPPSKLLIPLSYGAIVGGVVTLVGTSTNLVVNSFVVDAKLPPLEMFQFSLVGVPVALACIVVMTLCTRLLPANEPESRKSRQAYFLEAKVSPGSQLAGKSIEDNRLRNLEGLFLLEIEREERLISPVGPDEILCEGDILVFTGDMTKVQALHAFPGLHVFGTRADTLLGSNLVEVVISNESILANRTLREVDFRSHFDAGVVGIRRGDKRLGGQLGRISLRVGDSLLLAVGGDFAQHRNIERNFHVLDGEMLRPRLTPRQSVFTLVGFAFAIGLSAAEIWPLMNSLLVLLAALLLSRVLTLAELRRRFPFDLLLIIGSALTISRALESSGAAQLIADTMRSIFDGYGVYGAFVGVYLITLAVTEVIPNNAAAALAFPIGLSTARAFGADPTPFVMAVAYGASACFMVPFGYQTHLMVMSPGRYRVTDYFKAGLPVSLTYSAGVLSLVPVFFPF
ncbi:MAG TPA: SLC13 family permease [Aromatoleum sp.]|uniref:SLC13 family permease n=1 Tax=Aromatoleum sp. TaxID=2307007 RepID=UPI002B47E04E|nr:SLC13 family permease [Aromatoleum sp.]HJV28322.1 SLC13 family permease [Aromatoleum sp.]